MPAEDGYFKETERGRDGELIVREGLPERWHYTVQLFKEGTGVYGKIVVMFDGILRAHLWLPKVGMTEAEGVKRSRKRVLDWIDDYEARTG